MNIIRVFPRRTNATPTDRRAYVGLPDFFVPECDEVHISVTFSWDLDWAGRLAEEWRHVAPMKMGGPATGERGGEFEPGRYLKPGYVITSRGCPNRCWFCDVWKREGEIRELPIREGWNVLDSNLLACSATHVRAVFAMLRQQSEPVRFTGGLEAARLQDWHIDELLSLRLQVMFLAYDTPDDFEPLQIAAVGLKRAGLITPGHKIRCYVLIGYPQDTMGQAERRLMQVCDLGLMPMAMLYRDRTGQRDPAWVHFQKLWARPHIVGPKVVSI